MLRPSHWIAPCCRCVHLCVRRCPMMLPQSTCKVCVNMLQKPMEARGCLILTRVAFSNLLESYLTHTDILLWTNRFKIITNNQSQTPQCRVWNQWGVLCHHACPWCSAPLATASSPCTASSDSAPPTPVAWDGIDQHQASWLTESETKKS